MTLESERGTRLVLGESGGPDRVIRAGGDDEAALEMFLGREDVSVGDIAHTEWRDPHA